MREKPFALIFLHAKKNWSSIKICPLARQVSKSVRSFLKCSWAYVPAEDKRSERDGLCDCGALVEPEKRPETGTCSDLVGLVQKLEF
jgi:hypothetical protein